MGVSRAGPAQAGSECSCHQGVQGTQPGASALSIVWVEQAERPRTRTLGTFSTYWSQMDKPSTTR